MKAKRFFNFFSIFVKLDIKNKKNCFNLIKDIKLYN